MGDGRTGLAAGTNLPSLETGLRETVAEHRFAEAGDCGRSPPVVVHDLRDVTRREGVPGGGVSFPRTSPTKGTAGAFFVTGRGRLKRCDGGERPTAGSDEGTHSRDLV